MTTSWKGSGAESERTWKGMSVPSSSPSGPWKSCAVHCRCLPPSLPPSRPPLLRPSSTPPHTWERTGPV
jgi:hypothetical protein